MDFVGLIPCAGKGSRLGLPFSKEMFPDVHSKEYRPIIMHTIEAMKVAGIEHLIFTINPGKTDLLKFLGNGSQFGMKFTYCVHPEPKSLPESLNEAQHIIFDKKVIFAMPDTVIEPKNFISRLISYHNSQDYCEVSLGCFKTDRPSSFAMVDFSGDKVTSIEEKQKQSRLIWMWGTMVWTPEFSKELNYYVTLNNSIARDREMYLSDALENFISLRKVNIFRFEEGIYKDLGTYEALNKWSLD